MSFFNRFSIKTLFYALVVTCLSALLIMALGIYRSTSPINGEWTKYLDEVAKRQSILMEIRSTFGYGGVIHNFKNYVLRGQDKYFGRLDKGFARLDRLLDEYGALPSLSDDERKALKSIDGVAEEYASHLDGVRKMVSEGKSPTEIDSVVKVNDSPALEAFVVLDNVYQTLTDETSHAISNRIDNSLAWSLWAPGLTLVLIVVGIILISRIVIQGFERVTKMLQEVTEGNDLTIRLPAEGKHELATIARSVNELMTHFSELIGGVIHTSSAVSDNSANQTSLMESMVSGVHKQHQEIDQVATAMHEMSTTIQEVAENTQHSAKAAQMANEESQNGRQVMSTTVSKMDALRARVESTAQVIGQLDQESAEISKVLGVITGISEQTNLLALNAAIEAARAGEQGRGFAVVADEVRALAARTKSSADEIRNMIDRLQNEVRKAVTEMEESQENAQASSEQAGSASEAFDRIAHEIGQINEMITQIATATEEQSHVAEEMNKNIIAISEEASQTSESGTQTLEATAGIGTLIESLRAQASVFKVSG